MDRRRFLAASGVLGGCLVTAWSVTMTETDTSNGEAGAGVGPAGAGAAGV